MKKNLLKESTRKALLREFKVGQSKIAGKGLFADSNFDSGERLFPMYWLNKGESFNWRRAQCLPVQWPEDVSWGDLTWNVNHQKSSNCAVEREGDVWYCTSKGPLSKGTEITINYEEMPEFTNRDISGFIEIE